MTETYRETAIRFLKWIIATDFKKDIPEPERYRLKRFIEILEELG